MSRTRRAVAVLLAPAALSAMTVTGTQVASASPLPAGGYRLGKLEGTTLSVQEGKLDSAFVPERGDVAKFEIDGDRIGVLTTSGEVLVKEGNLYADWVPEMPGITDFHLAGDLIGVRRANGTLAVKEGGLSAGWTELIGDVKDFDLTPSRVGVVQTDGNALVKEGVSGGWVPEMPGIADIELAGDRIALKRTNNSLTVKEGPLDAGWNELIGDVKAFDVTPTRVGVVQTDGNALVKEGGLGAGWVPEMPGIADIELGGDRIALVRTNGSLTVKEGSLYAGWVEQEGTVTQADIAAGPPDVPNSPVTIQDLRAIYGSISSESTVLEGLPSLNAEMAAGGIVTSARKAAFLATLRRESGFRYNAVAPGDAWRGRGFIQLTGQGNYQAAGQYLGAPLAQNPDLAAGLQWSAPIARYYWTVARPDTNNAADRYDMGLISRYIGYAPSASEDLARCIDFKKALSYFNGGSLPVPESSIVCYRH